MAHLHGRDIINRAVVDLKKAAKIGSIADVIVDPMHRRVAGFIVQPEGGNTPRWTLAFESVKSVGPDAVTVSDGTMPSPGSNLAGLPTLDHLQHVKIVTSGGTYLGEIHDILFDSDSGLLLEYELDANLFERMFGREPRFPAEQVESYSGDMMIVPNEVASGHEQKHEEQKS